MWTESVPEPRFAAGAPLEIKVGMELMGRVIGGLGEPVDGKRAVKGRGASLHLQLTADPLTRDRIKDPLRTGVRVLDGLFTCGKGQRLGIFAGSGVGKSTLMGMIARNSEADVNVIALIGERGREVREFIEKVWERKGLKNPFSSPLLLTNRRY